MPDKHSVLASYLYSVCIPPSLLRCFDLLVLLVVQVQVSESVQNGRNQGIICGLRPCADISMRISIPPLSIDQG